MVFYLVDIRLGEFFAKCVYSFFERRRLGADFGKPDAGTDTVEFVRSGPNIGTGVPPVLFVLQITQKVIEFVNPVRKGRDETLAYACETCIELRRRIGVQPLYHLILPTRSACFLS